MASLAPAKPSRPPRTLDARMQGSGNGNGSRRTRRTSVLRQPRSRRDLFDRTRFRRAHVNAPVRRASQHSRRRQALMLPALHRSIPRLSYGPVSSTGSPPRAAVVSAPPSLAMSATVAMTFVSSPQVSAPPTATTAPLVIRRGRSATPLFLHRTPIFEPRSSASMSHLGQPRSSASISQLQLGRGLPRATASMSQLAPVRLPPSTFSRASAPAMNSRSASESAMPRTWMPSSDSEAQHIFQLRATMDRSSPSTAFSSPSTNYCVVAPTDGYHLSRLSPAPSPSASASLSPSSSPLPSPLPSPVLLNKALPPVPLHTEPDTSSEEDATLDLDFRFPPQERPSRIPSIRPVSFDAEATLRELEELAASIMGQDPKREVEQLAASLKVSGVPVIETNFSPWRENEMPAAMAEESSPITPRPPRLPQRDGRLDSVQPLTRLAVPHIVVTNPSTESLLGSLNDNGPLPTNRAGKVEDAGGGETEELQWMDDYGGWGASEKGKWKAVVGEVEEEEEGHEQRPKSGSRSPPRTSLENTYIYEPMGAPEFLVGSSNSPVARAASGYRSRRRPSKRSVPEAARVRRRKPAALMLANPAQAEFDELEASLANALFLGTAKPSRRPQTAPNTIVRPRQPVGPSAWLSSKKNPPSNSGTDAPPASGAANPSSNEGSRRSEPIPAMPLLPFPIPPSASSSRGGRAHKTVQSEGEQTVQVVPFPSFPTRSGNGDGTSSEPSTPRPSPRPRLKSLKGLFKHWSK